MSKKIRSVTEFSHFSKDCRVGCATREFAGGDGSNWETNIAAGKGRERERKKKEFRSGN